MKIVLSKIMVLLFIFTLTTAHSQEKTKKEQKEAEKTEKQKQMETLLNSKEFIFIADRAMPQGYRTVNLSSNYFLKIHPTTIQANLPFFGRAYSGTTYGADYGIKFNAAPSEYKLIKNKKNYEIITTVKGDNDTYRLNLSVGFYGDATLNVSSNKQSSISYDGTILPAEINNEN